LITDGACAPNPGTGGWCAIIKSHGGERILTGKQEQTTVNRMELTAALRGFQVLPTPCEVHVLTDSSYLVQGMTRWRYNWKRSGWLTRYGKPVENQDLWQALIQAAAPYRVTWNWAPGHQPDTPTDLVRADKMAFKASGVPWGGIWRRESEKMRAIDAANDAEAAAAGRETMNVRQTATGPEIYDQDARQWRQFPL
jgi:ribonuclease HI